MGLTDAAKEAIHLIGFLKELGFGDLADVVIYNDNQGAGKLASNPVFHSRSKHIDIRHHFVRQVLRDHLLKIEYTPTEDMIADVLTKALAGPKHYKCMSGLGVATIHSQPIKRNIEGEC